MKIVVAVDTFKGSLSSLEAGSAISEGIHRVMDDADIVITGEGRLDGQTVMGKAPIGVASIAKNIKNRLSHFPAVWSKMPLLAISTELMRFSLYCAP